MPTMFNEADRAGILARLDRLTPQTARLWGSLTPAGMVFHLNAQLQNVLGELKVEPRKTPGIMKTGFFHWLIMDSPMPWPKSAPTASEYLSDAPGELDANLAQLRSRLDRVAANGEARAATLHPAFGPLSGKQMGKLMWKHFNHHLTQFGL